MKFRKLPFRNLTKKPGRTLVLTVLVMILSFAVFGGAATIFSLRNGMKSLEARLGADVIVVPVSAKSKVNLDEMLLQGTVGYFYMDSDVLEKVREIDGVEKASAQTFLATLRADCCSIPVQVIGIDPDTDFTVQPWIAQSYGKPLETYDLIVGSKVGTEIGSTLRIYQQDCRVVGRLDSTGTGMDTAVYTTMDTMHLLLAAAQGLGHDLKITGDPDEVISAVYIKVKDDSSAVSVNNYINVHIRKVESVQTKNMLTTVSDGMAGASSTMTLLVGGIWVLTFLLIIAAFCMIIRERRQEFAVLRMLGASRKMLSGMIFTETAAICALSSALGILLACVVVFPFSGLIEEKLGLPFLQPGTGMCILLAAGTFLGVLLTGTVASMWTANRLSHVDTSKILREGN